VSPDAEEVLRIPADVVVHSTGSYLTDVRDQLLRCLAANHNVVSSCEELSYPLRKYPELSRELDEAAKQNKVTLHGTGVNPGFVMDKLP
jgi:4-hydroxy-tetrahydrodipicolinate reductase